MDISKYLEKDVVVFHCDTEEKANELLGKLHYLGFKWDDYITLLERNLWLEYGKKTCYYIDSENKGISYCDYDFLENKNIIEYVLDKENKVTDCENMNFGNILDVLENELFTENKMPVL